MSTSKVNSEPAFLWPPPGCKPPNTLPEWLKASDSVFVLPSCPPYLSIPNTIARETLSSYDVTLLFKALQWSLHFKIHRPKGRTCQYSLQASHPPRTHPSSSSYLDYLLHAHSGFLPLPQSHQAFWHLLSPNLEFYSQTPTRQTHHLSLPSI